MKSYTQAKVNPEIPGIIIMSHGALAVGVVETIKMLFGEPENLAAFSLEPGDDIDEYRKLFAKSFESFPDGTMVLVDLYGGTPCNQALQYAFQTSTTFELVTGINLPMLLNLVIARQNVDGKTPEEFTKEIIDQAREGISRVDVANFIVASANDDDDEDE